MFLTCNVKFNGEDFTLFCRGHGLSPTGQFPGRSFQQWMMNVPNHQALNPDSTRRRNESEGAVQQIGTTHNNPSEATIVWAIKCAELQDLVRAEDPNHGFPWAASDIHKIKNTGKAMYCCLMLLNFQGHIELLMSKEANSSFCGIIRIAVHAHKRNHLDNSLFPSVDGAKVRGWAEKDIKTLRKQWQTAGWVEKVEADGSLLFEYSEDMRSKLRQQQRNGNRNAKRQDCGDEGKKADEGEKKTKTKKPKIVE